MGIEKDKMRRREEEEESGKRLQYLRYIVGDIQSGLMQQFQLQNRFGWELKLNTKLLTLILYVKHLNH